MKTIHKRFVGFLSTLLTLSILVIASCEDSNNIVEVDVESNFPQPLIIKAFEENGDLGIDSVQEEISYSRMYITNWINIGSELTNFRFSKRLHSIYVDATNPSTAINGVLHTVRLGTVQLGDHILDESRCNSPETNCGGWRSNSDGVVIMKDWRYRLVQFEHYADNPLTVHSPIYELTGLTAFSINDSPVIKNLNTTLDIPPHNEILNILPGHEIDPNSDLQIQLKYPIGGGENLSWNNGVLVFWAVEISESGYGAHGTGGLSVAPSNKSDRVTIPSAELLSLLENHDNADFFRLELSHHYHDFAPILLYDHNNELFDTVKPRMYDSYEIEFIFAERDPITSIR